MRADHHDPGGRRWKALVATALALLAAFALTSCGGDSGSSGSAAAAGDTASGSSGASAGSPKIRVALAPTTTALPAIVADHQGFFKKHGVQVSWQVSNVSISDQLATLGRQFDIAMGTQPALITAANHGIPLVNVTGGALDTPDKQTAAIIAGKGTGITSVKDLAGKRVGSLTLTGNIHYAMLYQAKKAGVDPSRMNFVLGTVPQMPDQLKAGRVDAIEEIEPFAGVAVANGGVNLGDPFRAVSDKAYISIWLSQKQWADQNEDAINRFAAALQDAADWIAQNEDAARKQLGGFTHATGKILANTPIPDFHFSPTGTDLAATQQPDLETWIQILKDTSDFNGRKTAQDMLPSWAG